MADPTRILVVEDEPHQRRVLGALLVRDGYEVIEAADGEQALGLIGRGVAAIITDLKMPRLDGMGLLRRVLAEHPDVQVIMLTAHGSVDSAVGACKLGAFDYISKPYDHAQLRQVVQKAVRTHELDRRGPRAQLAGQLAGTAGKALGRFGLIGDSEPLRAVLSVVEKAADTPSTVLITGESGTGKELIARALHENSSRRGEPFIKINCSAIPKTLMESELFGYEKGAFTGAVGSKPGRFELADRGTLFLDEIGEIPVEMQAKLLRVLQESEFERVGGIRTIKVDVRMVTATNRDLQKEVASGNFREDLFYRLNVVPIHLPPLRERRGDIPTLVEHFRLKFNERLKKSITAVEADALDRLTSHHWQGNIRELENVIERTILFCDGPTIHAADLPPELQMAVSPSSIDSRGAQAPGRATSLREIVRQETERVERELIVRALDETSGNVTQAARKLKISRKSLQNKMKDFGLRDEK
ncbi:MAG: sigma-54-dependent Fis family transcriptional regulator [Myxococcales bacterium]|nr:sigma-54-dependent Fis family transcriptional regulator [Myxococcales bacterium]